MAGARTVRSVQYPGNEGNADLYNERVPNLCKADCWEFTILDSFGDGLDDGLDDGGDNFIEFDGEVTNTAGEFEFSVSIPFGNCPV